MNATRAELEFPPMPPRPYPNIWLREDRKRTAKALIVGGAALGWLLGGTLLAGADHSWIFCGIEFAAFLIAAAKTVSIYRSF